MPLSIFIFGNTNNYPYLLAEGFRSLGHNVSLVINKKELLHRPESIEKSFYSGYPEWIFDYSNLTDLDIAYQSYSVDEMMSTLAAQSDLAILNDIGPALVPYLRCPHVSLLTGSDLTYYGDFHSVEKRTLTWNSNFRRSQEGRRITRELVNLVARQRDGILTSSLVTYGARGLIPEGDALLDAIGVLDSQRMMIYLSDPSRVGFCPMPANRELKILSGARVVWKQNSANTYSAIDMKGTDVLVTGFAMYCRAGGRGRLHLPNKGTDIEETIALIKKFGIQNRVVWYENIKTWAFISEMSTSDIICDQFGQSFPGMVTTLAMALGRPVMANFRRELMPFHLPGLDVSTADEICAQLLRAEGDRSVLVNLGRISRKYAARYLAPVVAAKAILKSCF